MTTVESEVILKKRKMVPRAAANELECLVGDKTETYDEKNSSRQITIKYKMTEMNSSKSDWNFDDEFSDGDTHQTLLEDKTVVLHPKESMFSIALQVFVPYLIAGFGTVGAGLVLDIVQHWDVFKTVSEIFILVPALLGLKGNLEMTLASRLSTQANLGNMDTTKEQWKLATGNMALIQCQAIVVGFLASLFAMIMGWIPEGKFNLEHAALLCASSLVTASLASFVLGCVMVGVVICSRKLHINPDNVATPIAASLGDLTTLSLLAGISYVLYSKLDTPGYAISLIIFFLILTPLWVVVAKNNKYTCEVLYSGWTPVISAMAISSIGGCILDFAVDKFHGIAVFQPVINGVGGNLVAVQASRISTYLHQRSKLGVLPKEDRVICTNPLTTFFGNSIHSITARVLMLMVIPGHLVFTYGIRFMNAGHTSLTPMFLAFYLLAAVIQVTLLLYIAQVMVHWMWGKKIDPDNSAIPYLTALGDLLGTALLAVAFSILYEIGDKDYDVGE
ncbi:solute carrier family 41 member 1 isoform X2 [Parasteatoda tepidariorum]|uniref:solute carrier family 41 member 1 isoform X1 n=1 Tax=Parasteatoda tepidariorum TaxID=114398 RepID=UPI000A2C0B08|nr:solute carrier family 41 member 1 isoform X2 [Parasteatoda tepidariorum]XP_042906780.1 solute carrier family 41 member 1 isoform X1 [Parasteatoda tepidariorum]XP_042906781.1 solute carrier family 41 member 1 isoform X3 [Parasteatoda tepidariorum]XP_042906782.1 solute carrier family 41 member 1 isoform X2 [Parasteatoda tepidariorum]XP_042906783.1 solute carrier family 41 member 1 isoform X2 [Parasteatoda tepidariorum]